MDITCPFRSRRKGFYPFLSLLRLARPTPAALLALRDRQLKLRTSTIRTITCSAVVSETGCPQRRNRNRRQHLHSAFQSGQVTVVLDRALSSKGVTAVLPPNRQGAEYQLCHAASCSVNSAETRSAVALLHRPTHSIHSPVIPYQTKSPS